MGQIIDKAKGQIKPSADAMASQALGGEGCEPTGCVVRRRYAGAQRRCLSRPGGQSALRRVAAIRSALRGNGKPGLLHTRSHPAFMDSLLVLSDVHLGSDLNDFAQPIRRSRSVDDDLVKLITHYRAVAPPSDRWRLVIAGDFIDFVGMAVRADGVELATEPSDEERKHGLGNAVDHVRVKLRLVVERHRDVFDALAGFVADGHALTFVHGNHDLEFYWDAVKDDLRSLLFARASAARTDAIDRPAFHRRIAFHPWFFYVAGLAYIEHGHQYDAFCASPCVMAPLSADPRRITRSVSDVLLRFVVRPTRGMHEYGHDKHGVAHYLAFAVKLGGVGLLQLALRYAGAVRELFRLRREQLSTAVKMPREDHGRGTAFLARATRGGVDRMSALAALQVPPVTGTIGGILASVLLDRLALGFVAVLTLFVVAVLTVVHTVHVGWAAPCVALGWALGHRQLARRRTVDPGQRMIESAAHLEKLFPADFVVMGHTHTPARISINDGEATYINVGSWAEEEDDAGESADKTYRAPRTHLVIHRGDQGPVAEFLVWDGDRPRPFSPA
jgi:UDP-2,3-diacylglucosamine pyrophosphatase LpxH